MRVLTEAGMSMVCLSNGAAQTTLGFLQRTHLDRYVQQVIGVDEVRRWKPAGDVYTHALRSVDQPAEDVALVAVHAWDCHGARRAGLTTGWASRLERHYPEIYEPPDVVGADLVEVAERLTELPAAHGRGEA